MLQIKVKAGELKSLYGQYKKRLATSNEDIKDYFQSGQALDDLLAAFDESKQERVLYATQDSRFLKKSSYRYKTVYTWNYNIVCDNLKWRRVFGCIPETSPFWDALHCVCRWEGGTPVPDTERVRILLEMAERETWSFSIEETVILKEGGGLKDLDDSTDVYISLYRYNSLKKEDK